MKTATVTHKYVVEYVTGVNSGHEVVHTITVDAIDAIDAKHLAEAAEGEVIDKATAAKVR